MNFKHIGLSSSEKRGERIKREEGGEERSKKEKRKRVMGLLEITIMGIVQTGKIN